MLKFLIRRLVISLFVAVTVSIVGFVLLRMSGDLVAVLAGENATDADRLRVAQQYGLDRPYIEQYWVWLTNALRGDFGKSLFTHEAVSELIVSRIGVTATLAISALVVALLVAVPLGVIAAVKANTWVDRGALLVSVIGQATPNFWFALMLIYIFGVWWRQAVVLGVKLSELSIFGVQLSGLPISGSATWQHFIMPVITLSTMIMPPIMRLTRTGMIDVLGSDYVRTARAKGLSPFSVLFKHALRNAMLPVVSLAAVQLGFLLGGSVIVESIFALNGIGFLAFESIRKIDFPVVQSILVSLAFAYIGLTLISDVINARLDPRVRLT